MINVYANAEKTKKKEYTAIKITHGTARNDAPYTLFTISDSKKVGEQWQNEYYSVFVWKYLNIDEKDKIVFTEIQALEVKEEIWQGNKRLKRTIFAEVEVVSKSQPTEFVDINEASDLPF